VVCLRGVRGWTSGLGELVPGRRDVQALAAALGALAADARSVLARRRRG
jgi:hypothetical protein